MAAPWTTQRRPHVAPSMTPLATTAAQPSARAPISLDAWEAKITLDESHTRSINAIKRRCEEKPLPLKVSNILFDRLPDSPWYTVYRRGRWYSIRAWYPQFAPQTCPGSWPKNSFTAIHTNHPQLSFHTVEVYATCLDIF